MRNDSLTICERVNIVKQLACIGTKTAKSKGLSVDFSGDMLDF